MLLYPWQFTSPIRNHVGVGEISVIRPAVQGLRLWTIQVSNSHVPIICPFIRDFLVFGATRWSLWSHFDFSTKDPAYVTGSARRPIPFHPSQTQSEAVEVLVQLVATLTSPRRSLQPCPLQLHQHATPDYALGFKCLLSI